MKIQNTIKYQVLNHIIIRIKFKMNKNGMIISNFCCFLIVLWDLYC